MGQRLRSRFFTFVANFKLVKVSLRWACSGLIITNMRVFELPPRENCSRYVNYRFGQPSTASGMATTVMKIVLRVIIKTTYFTVAIGYVSSFLALT